MEHSKNFEKVKGFYDKGLWSSTKVKNAVRSGWITEKEFEEITGEPVFNPQLGFGYSGN